jgi:hypothetical protein
MLKQHAARDLQHAGYFLNKGILIMANAMQLLRVMYPNNASLLACG